MRYMKDRLLALFGLMTIVGFVMMLAAPHTLEVEGWTTYWIVATVFLAPALLASVLAIIGVFVFALSWIINPGWWRDDE